MWPTALHVFMSVNEDDETPHWLLFPLTLSAAGAIKAAVSFEQQKRAL